MMVADRSERHELLAGLGPIAVWLGWLPDLTVSHVEASSSASFRPKTSREREREGGMYGAGAAPSPSPRSHDRSGGTAALPVKAIIHHLPMQGQTSLIRHQPSTTEKLKGCVRRFHSHSLLEAATILTWAFANLPGSCYMLM